MHKVIFVPGLGDYNKNLPYLEKLWRKDGIDIEAFDSSWKNKTEIFEEKLARLTKRIDTLSKTGEKISLIGTSAGGSLVINAYGATKTKIHRLITVSARLLEGRKVFPPLSLAASGYPAFKDAVLSSEALLPTFTHTDKEKILTTQSLFWDEIVPISTMSISGVRKIKIPVPFHRYSIAATVTVYRKHLINFIQS